MVVACYSSGLGVTLHPRAALGLRSVHFPRPYHPVGCQVAALGMPPPERRADSLQALQGLDFFGGEVPDERQLLEWEVRQLLLSAFTVLLVGLVIHTQGARRLGCYSPNVPQPAAAAAQLVLRISSATCCACRRGMLRTEWCCCRMCGWTAPKFWTACTPFLRVGCSALRGAGGRAPA